MSKLLQAIERHECRTAHQKMVMDALRLWNGSSADAWRPVFLRYFEDLHEGSDAPETSFRSSPNHVVLDGADALENACLAARRWYARTVKALRERDWSSAAFALGICGFYASDPLQRLHTGDLDADLSINRAVQWSIFCNYESLRQTLTDQLGGYPQAEVAQGDDWLIWMIQESTEAARRDHAMIIEQFSQRHAAPNSPAALADEIRKPLAGVVGRAVANIAAVSQRSCQEAAVEAPRVALGMMTTLLQATSPMARFSAWLHHRRQQRAVQSPTRG